jgi:hypothetical protein
MKNIFLIIISLLILSVFYKCDTTAKSVDIIHYKDSLKIEGSDFASIHIEKGKEFNHPTFVIWLEDTGGTYIETVFITKSYASGVFGYAALTDSTWDNKPGESIQPAALPYWTHKKGIINNKVLVPTKEHPYIDAYSGETPKSDFRFDTKLKSAKNIYRILLEVNQPWDWNNYWTNNKYPESESYKHSAQPSLIYAVTMNKTDKEFYMNPIGHGDPKGETDKLFTNLNTITGAKEIFKSIKIVIK